MGFSVLATLHQEASCTGEVSEHKLCAFLFVVCMLGFTTDCVVALTFAVSLSGMALVPQAMMADGLQRYPESDHCQCSGGGEEEMEQHRYRELIQSPLTFASFPPLTKRTTKFCRGTWIQAARH